MKNCVFPDPVMIGDIPLGAGYPIRIQSMTNTDTMDTESTVNQCIRIIEAGADFVRITAPGIREAENLRNIKEQLRKRGYGNPLIADIHFNPKAAETAARIVEKVRINPGNYADKRAVFSQMELSEKEYAEELERIHGRLLPLINICREYGTAIRIGINHGSLSDRIMSRYGNTVEGMVTSAKEFISMFRAENFKNIVLSMKSSDTAVMVAATRSLAEYMKEEQCIFPVHLGVTEAGEGEDGRIRSATGIGALLFEGIGDTVRVSLSEAPENEIPVAREIIDTVCANRHNTECIMDDVEFARHDSLYKPLVVSHENDRFISEAGNEYQGPIITLRQNGRQVFSADELHNSILHVELDEDDSDTIAIKAAAIAGRFFITGQPAGLCISNKGKVKGDKLKEIAFAILQAAGARITQNRYISCPTCGRTKYDLPAAVKKVKEATKHLTGLKIAVMGCVVNGPGEMAGADFGYVGTGQGKVNIYRGLDPIRKNIPEDEAINVLLEVIDSTKKK